LELCAVLYHVSPMALYRLICALGQQSVVTVLTRCRLLLPVYCLADAKHSRCLTEKAAIPAARIKSYATLSSAQSDSLSVASARLSRRFFETESLRSWLKRRYPSCSRRNFPTTTGVVSLDRTVSPRKIKDD